MTGTTCLDLRRGPPREASVVAFPEPGVTDNRERPIAESDLGRANRPCQVRTKYGRQIVVTPTGPEAACLFFTCGRQSDVEPAGSQPGFVIEAGRVGFEDEILIRMPAPSAPDVRAGLPASPGSLTNNDPDL
jgi:hypothetical protein